MKAGSALWIIKKPYYSRFKARHELDLQVKMTNKMLFCPSPLSLMSLKQWIFIPEIKTRVELTTNIVLVL